MMLRKSFLSLGFCFLMISMSFGHINPNAKKPPKPNNNSTSSARFNCTNHVAQIDMDVNNVRARLTSSGDVWWDGDDGKYVVPKVPAGIPEVSSLFAGAVWLGGVDPAGNLKIAAQQYGRSPLQGPSYDFWPGPLILDDEGNGVTNSALCLDWDRFFIVSGSDVRDHRALYEEALAAGGEINIDPDKIPEAIKGWPALGNEFFEDIHGFPLPFDKDNGLAGFWDRGPDGLGNELDGLYNPEKGDFPIVEIRGCNEFPLSFPDQMMFWIYNDNGNIHSESGSELPIGMEVQVQAFAFESNDAINDMTFQRYKLINRALEDLNDTYFAMWIDGDLGCYTDDYIGCDTSRSLAYLYNQDQVDGTSGCDCEQGVNTYCDNVPILGVDYFRGPLDENFKEIGMSSFTYLNNGGFGGPNPATTDPENETEYYNCLSGKWKDGTSLSQGGEGYDPNSTDVVNYAFIDPPNEGGWSMCSEGLPAGDRRTLQASGPFTLEPTAKNELIIGVVWIPEVLYPCPDISKLLDVDDLAQNIFDNCFEIPQGPSAPDMDFIELDREVIAILTNKPGNPDNNNINENYAEWDLRSPGDRDDTTYFYKFEGYRVYQLRTETSTDLENPEDTRIVRQMDVKNDIDIIFNWTSVVDPATGLDIWFPVEQVNGNNEGIEHSFRITDDRFASGDTRLINHKEYYFSAISYAYNNWKDFTQDISGIDGQRSPYLTGRLNINEYTVVPRPLNDLVLNSFYGEGPVVERLDGAGSQDNFLEMEDGVEASILDGSFNGTIPYKPGQAPIQVKIVNPVEVQDGDYTVSFYGSPGATTLDDRAGRWSIKHEGTDVEVFSDKALDTLNEQIIPEFGISLRSGRVEGPGESGMGSNGALGAEVSYEENGSENWYFGLPATSGQNSYILTGSGEPQELLDQAQTYTNQTGIMAPGFFVPGYLAEPTTDMRISPASENNIVSTLVRSDVNVDLRLLNNVNIVFTSDKTKWSRCIVVETSSSFYFGNSNLGIPTQDNRRHMDLRGAPSVTKEAGSDGLPMVDAAESRLGFAWFPGYAIDVETGKRLNIFFGENSSYDCETLTSVGMADICSEFNDPGQRGTGRDMMWNPSDLFTINTPVPSLLQAYLGGHHWVYVTNEEYDGCEQLYVDFSPGPGGNPLAKARGMKKVTWVSTPVTSMPLLSYAEGLIPSDMTYKLRVSTPLTTADPAGPNGGFPQYRFTISGKEAQPLTTQDQFDEQLAGIRVVPNPYYGYSNYEVSQFANTVKLTNLPNTCDVSIYSLEGKFIRSYKRNVGPNTELTRNGINAKQPTPNLEWDLKNSAGIPIASGTYLIYVDAPGLGETVVKFFAVQRQFDPSGL